VIASKANDFVGRPLLKIYKELNDAATIRAPIDVITEKDEPRSLRSRVLLAKVDEPLELVSTAMNIADRVNVSHASFQNSEIVGLYLVRPIK